MASLEDLLENKEWRTNWNYAVTQAPNQGYMRRWPEISGMHSPMNIWSTEASTLSLKHGTNDPSPYRVFIHPNQPFVTPQMQQQVSNCVQQTWNGEYCVGKALYTIAKKEDEKLRQVYANRFRIPPSGPQD